jgi:hypothetical protein
VRKSSAQTIPGAAPGGKQRRSERFPRTFLRGAREAPAWIEKEESVMSINTIEATPHDVYEALKLTWDKKMIVSSMLHGEPGVGKSMVVDQLAKAISGKLYDVRLPTIDVANIQGLPYYCHETKQTVWYRPEDLPSMGPAVLFLDEISSASPQLQPLVYGLLQERRVGKFTIPDDVMIIAAGNTVEDGAIAYELNSAISDRMIHYKIKKDPDQWLRDFAVPRNLHPAVVAFIKTRPDLLGNLQECLKAGHLISTTPRSWERASMILYNVADRGLRNLMLSGTLGSSVAADLAIVVDDLAASTSVQAMIEARRADRLSMYPNTLHGLNALVYGLTGYFTKENLEQTLEILLDMRDLARLRPNDEEFRTIMVRELAVNGLEMVFTKAVTANLVMELAKSSAYLKYSAERKDLGLSSTTTSQAA